jgi:hypothetical protein
MTLGDQLIAELGRCGNRGRFFDYRGYQTLRSIDCADDLHAFLDQQGYRRLPLSDDVAQLARALEDRWPGPFDLPLLTLGVGAAMGVVAFTFSMVLIPSQLASNHDHDRLLAQNLGIVFPLLLGFWSGYVQQSLRAILVGISVGALLGGLHRGLCGYDSMVLLLVSPIFLSGAAALGMGRGPERWSQQARVRLMKGVLLGVGLLLVGISSFAVSIDEIVTNLKLQLPQYRQLLWLTGPICMAIMGGFFLVFFHWAAGLKHLGWGPRLRLRASYRDTEGLDQVSGTPLLAWNRIVTRLEKTDPDYRRWHRRYCLLVLGIYPLCLAGIFSRFWLREIAALPPQLVRPLSDLIRMVSFFPSIMFMWIGPATLQAWRNARVTAELKKYPDGIPPDEERQDAS